jgi:hypothetical protein
MTIILKKGDWAIFNAPEMEKRWHGAGSREYLLHLPCETKAEKDLYGECFPASFVGSLSNGCKYCETKVEEDTGLYLAKVISFIYDKH